MDSLTGLFNHGSKGGGGGGSRKLESGGGMDRRRLERRNATKNINYEHTRKRGVKYDSESSYDESDSTHSREDPFVFDEYRVMGKASVDEMNEVCRYLGLPAPDSLGITREDWNANKVPPPHVVIDSISSVTQEDPSDFTFVVSPSPTHKTTSPQDSFREANSRFSDTGEEQVSGDYGVSISPSARDADAAAVAIAIEKHRVGEQEPAKEIKSHRVALGWRTRSASLPTTQNRSFSPPASSLVMSNTPRPLMGNRIFQYPDPVTHIIRAKSQPVHLPSHMRPGSVEAHVVGEEEVHNSSTLGSKSVPLEKSGTVEKSSADPASVVTREDFTPRSMTRRGEGDFSSRSSSGSDGSGEYSSNSSGREASRSPDQGSFQKMQDGRGAKVFAPSKQGSLSRPPPISLLNLPSSAFSTHELLDGLGPSDPSGTGRHNSESDSEDDVGQQGIEQPSSEESDTDAESQEGTSGRSQQPAIEVIATDPIQIAVTSSDGNKATDAGVTVDEGKDGMEVRSTPMGSNGELSTSIDTQENTKQIMSINLAQSPRTGHEEEVEQRRPCDGESGVQTLTFPWSKGDLLGAGSFGTVYEAVDSNGSFFAVKEVSLIDTDKNSQQCISQLEQEIELLSRFKHDNIVQYLGTQRADGKLYIFLELVSKGSLASLCKKFRLTHSQIIAYTRQILKGLKYLHDMNVVHRDIKCANILVDVKGTCKLADFGLAKQISALDQLKSCKGSAYWKGPEVIDPKKTYWLPADIWSLGCTVIEMFTGCPPNEDQEWYRVLWKVGHGETSPIPEEIPEDARDFIRQCLQVNPSKRPTAAALLDHRFLKPGTSTTVPPVVSLKSESVNIQRHVHTTCSATRELRSSLQSSGTDDAGSRVIQGAEHLSSRDMDGEPSKQECIDINVQSMVTFPESEGVSKLFAKGD